MTSITNSKEKKILLVEDEPNYRTLVLTILRRAGMNCIVCIDGDHAMKKLAQEKFDLIIIDYLLPGPNAVEVLSWARKQGIETPALIITNYPSDELTEKVKSLSSAQVLAKPLFDTFSMPAIVMKTLES